MQEGYKNNPKLNIEKKFKNNRKLKKILSSKTNVKKNYLKSC